MSYFLPDEHPERMGYWEWVRNYWLATLRLSSRSICVMSRDKGLADYHDYSDSEEGVAFHFGEMTCGRCGKSFII